MKGEAHGTAEPGVCAGRSRRGAVRHLHPLPGEHFHRTLWRAGPQDPLYALEQSGLFYDPPKVYKASELYLKKQLYEDESKIDTDADDADLCDPQKAQSKVLLRDQGVHLPPCVSGSDPTPAVRRRSSARNGWIAF